MRSSVKQAPILVIVVLAILGAMTCLGLTIPRGDFIFNVAFGWASYLRRVIPQVHVRWDVLVSTIAYVAALLVGAHLFLGWLYQEMRRVPADATYPVPSAWRWRWTSSGFALVILMFTSGIAAIGVVHQTTWLVRSPEALYRPSETTNRLNCAKNLFQMGRELEHYATKNAGKFPDDLSALRLQPGFWGPTLLCPSREISDEEPRDMAAEKPDPGHYVYLGKGLTLPVDPTRPVIIERVKNHFYEGMNVLFGDLHVEWLDAERAEGMLKEVRALKMNSQVQPSPEGLR